MLDIVFCCRRRRKHDVEAPQDSRPMSRVSSQPDASLPLLPRFSAFDLTQWFSQAQENAEQETHARSPSGSSVNQFPITVEATPTYETSYPHSVPDPHAPGPIQASESMETVIPFTLTGAFQRNQSYRTESTMPLAAVYSGSASSPANDEGAEDLQARAFVPSAAGPLGTLMDQPASGQFLPNDGPLSPPPADSHPPLDPDRFNDPVIVRSFGAHLADIRTPRPQTSMRVTLANIEH